MTNPSPIKNSIDARSRVLARQRKSFYPMILWLKTSSDEFGLGELVDLGVWDSGGQQSMWKVSLSWMGEI